MSDEKTPSLRVLNRQFSPDFNPLMEPETIAIKQRYVRTSAGRELVDPLTGEVSAVAKIHMVEEKDDQEFVKVFAAGVKAIYGLKKAGYRVFQAILTEYQNTKMQGGFADSVYLHWFDGKLCGRVLDMSERTFQNGLKELLLAGFLAPRSANLYWVNPALFFKGNRVAFVREYRRKRPSGEALSQTRGETPEPVEHQGEMPL